jgi:Predicted endonuclease distantly related to archaeal Holliday junction resolvase
MNQTARARQKVINWRKLFGTFGEALVCRWLKVQGWEIIERNWRCGRSPEIDIVARTVEGEIVVIEVKTRSGGLHSCLDNIASAVESVNGKKRRKLMLQSIKYGEVANCRVRRVELIVVAVPPSVLARFKLQLEAECSIREGEAQFQDYLKLDGSLLQVVDEAAQDVDLARLQIIRFDDILGL